MAGPARWVRVGTTVVCTELLAAGCGGGDARSGESSVTSQVVSDPTTQDIHVFASQGKGASSVVVALHGVDGSGRDMGASRLGWPEPALVVFAPTYRSDLTTSGGFSQATDDLACGYRFARTTASQHGGGPHPGRHPAWDGRWAPTSRSSVSCPHRPTRPRTTRPWRQDPPGRRRRHLRLLLRVPGQADHLVRRCVRLGEQGGRLLPARW